MCAISPVIVIYRYYKTFHQGRWLTLCQASLMPEEDRLALIQKERNGWTPEPIREPSHEKLDVITGVNDGY